jgi:glycosidase
LLCGACSDSQEPADDSDQIEEVEMRPVVYQLAVRLFGNIKGTNEWDGDMATNGVGKFAHIDRTAIAEIKDLGATHIWLTGVLQQATHTDYSHIGEPADDPDILKGKAGSFYAIKDYFDVSPDYALDPERRMAEFEALVDRIHAADMKVIIDLVPNHVARSYASTVKPELDFGADDDTSQFFDPQNNYFYLVDPPGQALSIPEPEHWPRPPGADGTYERENNTGDPPGDVPKVTGNEVTTAELSVNDWYETIKLNYGYDFTTGEGHYDPVPDTWEKMDQILAYWQDKGVDGFRCDFAHLVPVEAWKYLIERARERDPEVYFVAEAYEGSGGPPGFSFSNFVQVGFDAIYDAEVYHLVKGIYCCGNWANDIDEMLPGDFMFSRLIRFAENHDETRIASPLVEGTNSHNSGFGGFEQGKPAAGMLYLLGDGPLLLYNGQEVGEEGAGSEGFSGEDGRTSIFDYWTMPRMAEWVNGYAFDGGGLDADRKALRAWYKRLLALAQKPGIASGNIYSLQAANRDDDAYSSGQWLYSFMRYDTARDAVWIVVANFGDQSFDFGLKIPDEAAQFAGFDTADRLRLTDRMADGAETIEAGTRWLDTEGVSLQMGAYGFKVLEIEWDQ